MTKRRQEFLIYLLVLVVYAVFKVGFDVDMMLPIILVFVIGIWVRVVFNPNS